MQGRIGAIMVNGSGVIRMESVAACTLTVKFLIKNGKDVLESLEQTAMFTLGNEIVLSIPNVFLTRKLGIVLVFVKMNLLMMGWHVNALNLGSNKIGCPRH